jgi:hypothetical protein
MGRTVNQQMGDSHEADIAEWIQGSLQKGSGNQWHRQGDAKNGEYLTPYPITADGKSTLGQSISVSRTMWRKIVEQTFGQSPAIFLRFYKDDRLREVEIDLAVVNAQTFSEILADARQWQSFQDSLDRSLTAPPFAILAQEATFEWTGPYFCPTAEEVEQKPGGGFDQCCERPDLHLPLPEGEATDTLSRLLSDRLRAKVKTDPGCDCCR